MKALAVATLIWSCLAGVPAAWAEQPILAVMDFAGSDVSPGELALFGDFMTSHIVQTGQYTVVDRMQRQAQLQEIEFSYSDCADESCQLRIGRMLAAGSIVVGSLGRFGDRFLVNAKLIEVETGKTENAASRTYASLAELLEDSRSLTLQLLGLQAPAAAGAAGAAEGEPPAAYRVPERSIKVDGDTSDWNGLPPAISDPAGDNGIEEIYLAMDRKSIYVRFALAGGGLPARVRGYMQALLAINLMNGDYLLLAAFYRDGWRAAVQTWSPKTGKSAPIAFGTLARGGNGFEARFPIAAVRRHVQEGKAFATSAKIGVAVEKRYRDLDTAGPRFIVY